MLSVPMGDFQGPFSNINNCLEHGFPFISWRIAKLWSHFTAYSRVLISSPKWCWCYIHATGLQWIATEFLAWEDWFSKGVQLIVKMSEGRKPENSSGSPSRGMSLWMHSLRQGSGWILQDEELDFTSYSKETKTRLLTIINLTRQGV